ncbi:hypothetical protein L2249_17415, partial [Xanthomonas perforans]|uniref:hypothetical protein n=1 Tax=Xanthomonas perforans TaxID=442694 RepID=UPI001F3E784E
SGTTAAIIDNDIAVANRFIAVLLDSSVRTVARLPEATNRLTAHAPRNTAHQSAAPRSACCCIEAITHIRA